MARTTIDFGIDLGTTNSTIAQLTGTSLRVFKNNLQSETTPSAVYINPRERLQVGQQAKNHLVDDEENAFSEFKPNMGKDYVYVFARNGRKMKPEDLSAEVLKALRQDVLHQTGEDIQTAVITVPAAFELPACDATKRAAEQAGLLYSPLLQEPVAAAQAYGFQDQSDKVFWLVYDFGGGTFDAAVIQIRDGLIEVVNHEGDNKLGGKDIDWDIVNMLLIPALTQEYALSDFRRGVLKWRSAIAKLKQAAEDAKVILSRSETAEIEISALCEDERGQKVDFFYELTRDELARIAAPYIKRSINLCRKALTTKRLGTSDIEKILLVGGTTFMPAVRDALADPREGLGIPLEFSIDPITVVAHGAAIFAGMQRLPNVAHQVEAGQFKLELEYEPAGAEEDPPVGGLVLSDSEEELSGYTIEFINKIAQPAWRSGKVKLDAKGFFITNLWAEKGRQNTYEIELLDPTGRPCETVPDRLSYTCTVGGVLKGAPLTSGFGVAMANNEVDVFFEKGTKLEPKARRRRIHKTAYFLKRGQDGEAIKIPFVEGEYPKADRNKLVGYLTIPATEIIRDLPEGSDIEIIIEIDASRLIRTAAYVPILDQEFEKVLTFEDYTVRKAPGELVEDVRREKERLDDLRQKVEATGDTRGRQVIQAIDEEETVRHIDDSLKASTAVPEAIDDCDKRRRELMAALDEVEESLEWPSMVAEAEEQLGFAHEIVESAGSHSDKLKLVEFESEIRKTIAARDPDRLRSLIDELFRFRFAILREDPSFMVGWFYSLAEKKDTMRDQSLAERAVSKGEQAISSDDVDGLKVAIDQLLDLLPPAEREEMSQYGGGTRR